MKRVNFLDVGQAAVVCAAAAFLAAGCATKGPVVRKNSQELATMEQAANLTREHFFLGSYGAAEAALIPHAAEQHVNQPLYKCELASIALLAGDKHKADARLKEAMLLLQGFYDAEGEASAASIWGSESGKVYKGDPYERALLYTFYGMSLLEKGDVDNALAAFKRALLMDGDTEKQAYQSDFGLPQLLAAKCHDLRGETEARDKLLRAASDSYLSLPGVMPAFAQALHQEYARAKAANQLDRVAPSPLLLNLCVWGGIEPVAQRCALTEDLKSWLAQHAAKADGLGFNTLLIGWEGHGPSMSRAGEYGEKRIIHPGYETNDFRMAYSACLAPDGALVDAYPWLGNVSFQAITRGGRRMDNVLARNAAIKGGTDIAGNVMIAAGVAGMLSDSDNYSPAGAVLAGGGLVLKGLTYMMTAQADIRCWQCLPHELTILPLNVPPGDSSAYVTSWVRSSPRETKEIKIKRQATAPVTFVHYVVPGFGPGTYFFPGYDSGVVENLLALAVVSPDLTDPNGDGEISPSEREQALATLLRQFDTDGNGKLDQAEVARLKDAKAVAMKKRMGS